MRTTKPNPLLSLCDSESFRFDACLHHAYIMHVVCGPGHPELLKSCMDMAIKLLTFTFTLQLLSHFRVKEDILAAQFQGVAGIVRSSPRHPNHKRAVQYSTVLQHTRRQCSTSAVSYSCLALSSASTVCCITHCV